MSPKGFLHFIELNAVKYADLLKNGIVKCRDFTDDTIVNILKNSGVDAKEFPPEIRAELICRKFIPPDSSWESFSPDMLINILNVYPHAFENWHNWSWKSVSGAGSKAWCELLKNHPLYAKFCPQQVFDNLSFEERSNLASDAPILADRLNLNSLPFELQDELLFTNPELAGFFDFSENDPPGKLRMHIKHEECYTKETEAVDDLLTDLLPHLPRLSEITYQSQAVLGIFSQTRGKLLEMQIMDFLEKNYIPLSAISVAWNIIPQPVRPVSSLENLILSGSCQLIQSCMDGETLSRPDVLLTPEFAMLRKDIICLILKKAVSCELLKEALAILSQRRTSPELLALFKSARDFEKTQKRSAKEQSLINAVKSGEINIFRDLDGKTKVSCLSAEEALEIFSTCKSNAARNFFNNAITPMLRAFLIAELDKMTPDTEKNGLINRLLKPYWYDGDNENFVEFVSK